MSYQIAKLEFDNEQIGSEIVWYTFKNKTKEEHIYVKETIEEIFSEKTNHFIYYVTNVLHGLQGFLIGNHKEDKLTVDVLSIFVTNTYGLESQRCVGSRQSKYIEALFAPLRHIRVNLKVALDDQQIARKVYKLGFRLNTEDQDIHNNAMLANMNNIKKMSTDEWHHFVDHHCLFSFLEKNLYVYDPQMSDAQTHQQKLSLIPFLPIFNDLDIVNRNPLFDVQFNQSHRPSKIQSYICSHRSRMSEPSEDMPALEQSYLKMVEAD